jgi:hypothetical protein
LPAPRQAAISLLRMLQKKVAIGAAPSLAVPTGSTPAIWLAL